MRMMLLIPVKPTWSSLGKPPAFIEIDVDSNITINCDVTALPLPTFQWFVNGTPLRQGECMSLLISNKSDKQHYCVV